MMRDRPLDTVVPPDEDPVGRCPYCDRPFRSAAAVDLHVGEVHPEVATTEEVAAYEAAAEAEQGELFYFHLKVVFALGLTNAALILAYLVVLG